MSKNKSALIRYKAIDACLSNFNRKFFIEDIVAKCNELLAEEGLSVKKRQVIEDMRFIESEVGYATTIEKIPFGKKKYYRYESPKISIREKEPLMNANELAVLKSAIGVLQKVKGLPHYDWLDEIVPRLSLHFKQPPLKKEIIDFEDNKYLTGKHYLGYLFQYILEEKVLQVEYKPFTQSHAELWLLHPYYLKQHNHRWFCLGYVEQKGMIQTLALDRIVSMKILSFPHKPNVYLDMEQYFKDFIGITKPQNESLTLIQFKVAPERSPYVLTKPLHSSQIHLESQKDAYDWDYFSIEVIPNLELQAKILELGNHIEIISPQSLRMQIAARLQQAYQLYTHTQ